MITLSEAALEFPLESAQIYLNHAAVAPWPKRTADAICAFARENHQSGAKNYLHWLEIETRVRQQLATLINAPHSDDIGLLKNTSEGLSFVAYGLDWQPGDNIVISNQEFPSNRVVWESLAPLGVEVRQVDLNQAIAPEQSLIQATDERTRLLSISSVQYASGLRMHLPALGEFCRRRGILFCVDAIQSLGALEFDVQAIQADFVVADGHKWMLAPEGVALFYARRDCRTQLKLHEYGWHMLRDPMNYQRQDWEIAESARRFECGSPNMLGIHGLHASLELIQDVGVAHIEAAILERSCYLMQLIDEAPDLDLLSNPDPDRVAGIVTFRHRTLEAEQLYKYLMQAGVVCAARGGGVRFSAHFYTPLPRLAHAVKLARITP